jgi:hypothetical protein
VLDDFPAGLRAALPDYLRARMGPELACAALAYGHADGGAAVLSRRRAAFVRVYGAGRVGACATTFLAASGVAAVACLDTGPAEAADVTPAGLGAADVGTSRAAGVARAVHRVAPEVCTANDARRLPDLAVIAGRPDPVLLTALARDRVPHLIAQADEAIGVVGPLVTPGRSACVRCVDLSKAARDPAWPRILAQASGPAAVQACGTVLAAATAALAAAQALTLIDRVGEPAAANGTLEVVLPEWQWQRRGWPPHPACTCGAAGPRSGARASAAARRLPGLPRLGAYLGPMTSVPPSSGPRMSVPPFSSPRMSVPPSSWPRTSLPPSSGPRTSVPPSSSPNVSKFSGLLVMALASLDPTLPAGCLSSRVWADRWSWPAALRYGPVGGTKRIRRGIGRVTYGGVA